MRAFFATALPATAVSRIIGWGVAQTVWPWLYGEGMIEIALKDVAALATKDDWWQQWARHGRLFGPTGELAWWQQPPGTYKLRLLLENGTPPPIEDVSWERSETWTPWGTAVPTLLHGRLDRDLAEAGQLSWTEDRIPGEIAYPVQVNLSGIPSGDSVRAVLETQAYTCGSQAGLTRLIRLATRTIPEGTSDVG